MKVIAVIGCGRISKIHFPALQVNKNVRIKYACDLLIEKANEAKNTYTKVENAITDYKIALQDKEVDAVYVLTPNYQHYTITMEALRAGKHVFCEKPITINYELSKEMALEAEKQNKMLCIGVVNRFNKSIEMLTDMVKNGEFGNVYHVYCSFRSFRSIPGLGGAFTTKSQSGGGVLIDWGVHFFDLIYYVLGGFKLQNITCDSYSEMAKDMKSYVYKEGTMWAEDTADIENGVNDVDDFISGYIRTDKASISFNGAWAQNIDQTEMFVDFLGDKGGARLTYGGKFTFYKGSNLESVTPDISFEPVTEFEIPSMFVEEDKAFIDCITSGVKARNHIDYVLESAKLLDGLYKSADVKKEIEF
jgi:predicted dehydrogenase